jgi:enolase
MKIEKICAREIYDSRGYPTIACDLMLSDGSWHTASVPSGASKGSHEAFELRDGGDRLLGKGVRKNIEIIERVIAPTLIGKEPMLVTMDAGMLELDDTENRSRLGANTILAVSMAICRAQAAVEMMSLYEFIPFICQLDVVAMPVPMINILNGGAHANTGLSIQEFMIVPQDMDTFTEAMEFGTTVFHELKKLLHARGKLTLVGDEGGFAPSVKNTYEALDYLQEAINHAKKYCKGNATIALDIAASQLYNSTTQRYTVDGRTLTTNELLAWYLELTDNYQISSIEDGLHDNDWAGWEQMVDLLGDKIMIVGDDIFATNPERIWSGIERNASNAVIIKPNQIGTVTETLQAIKLCEENGVPVVVSHRSGETNDSFIADLAIGVSAQYIKAGGCSRGERLAKYNRLMQIEQELFSECAKI